MEKSPLALVIGILTLLGVSLGWTTMGTVRSGLVFATLAFLGLIMAIKDNRPRGIRTAAQVVCLISLVLNLLVGIAFTRGGA